MSHLQVHTTLCFSNLFNRDEGNKKKQVSIESIGFELCPQFRSVTHVAIMAAASLLSTFRWLLTLLTLSESVLKQVLSVFCTQAFHRRTHLMLYCCTIDCFYLFLMGVRFMMVYACLCIKIFKIQIQSPAMSRCSLCKNLLIGRVLLYVSQKSEYHLREGLLHICCL